MGMFIAPAFADTGAAAGGGSLLASMLPLILIIVVFYFLLIRPQQKRQKAHKTMLGNLQKGDEVVVGAGIYGRVKEIGDSHVSVATDDTTVLTVQKSSVTQVLPKGTIEKLS